LKSALCGKVGTFPLRLPAPVFGETLFVFDMQQIFVLTPLSKAEGSRLKAEGGIETGLRCRAAQINHGGAAATALPSLRVWRGSRFKICVSSVSICGSHHPQLRY
jgi:hypothetical protein